MKKPDTFNLEAAISAWRNSLIHERAIDNDDIEELEQHIRDHVDDLVRQGQSEAEAFDAVMESMGSLAETKEAFEKVYWGKIRYERTIKQELIWRISMIRNYIKIAGRNLRKQKGFAFINIFGLAAGLTCFILIALFVRHEFSYDRFHEQAGRIYRIVSASSTPSSPDNSQWAYTSAPFLESLQEEFPEVEHATQFTKAASLIESGEKRFYENGIFARGHFFDVFSFPSIGGVARTALEDPNSIILTRSLAEKYFGAVNPVGQMVTVSHSGPNFSGKKAMRVAAVIEDVPANSHFSFDYVVPVSSSNDQLNYLDRWDSNSYYTFALLRPGHSISAFEQKLPEVTRPHLSEAEYYAQNPGDMPKFIPQALSSIHLYANVNGEFGVNGDIKYVYLFSAVALLILLIACINYVNLTTARSALRSMEVGVRKVMGAHRRQLIGQFMSEAILPSLFALLIAVVLVVLLLPAFNELTAREMTLNLSRQGAFLGILLLIGLGVGLLAGSYPALTMSSFNPVGMMKGVLNRISNKKALQNTLVVLQFSITIALIVGVVVIQRQLQYIQSANTGIDRHQVIAISVKDETLHERFPALKQSLLSNPDVLRVTAAQSNPTDIDASSLIQEWEGAEEGQRIKVNRSAIRYDYLDFFGIQLTEGRDFSQEISTDEEEGIIINESLKRQLGWEEAVGKQLSLRGRTRVIGVIEDFNFHSFYHAIEPLALTLESGWWFPYQRIYVKAGAGEMRQTLDFLQQTMAEFSPDHPFEYYFLDDAYNQMYQTEMRLGSLLSYFTGLALLIACLGLLGLATFTAQQRTKEIGVRKVLGATHSNILLLLSKDFTRLVLIAFVLAVPVSYLMLSRWLEEFAFKVSLGWGTFVVAGGVVLIFAWLTVSYQSMRAALANPVDSLRHE